jgi:OOP family OmpA-OmpF porin
MKWRFEARRTGRTYAEVVLLRTLVYWVDQVFLIHRETGLVLQHVAAQNAVVKDPNLVGSMLSAIKDFMSDSFTLPQAAPVQSFQVGDCNVMLEEGRLAVVAAVVRGNPPRELSRTIQETLETIHLLYGEVLDRFDGDTAVFEGARDYLEDCLTSQPKQGARKKPWRALLLLMVLLGGPMLYWGYQTYQHRQQERLQRETWDAAVQSLRQEPGLVVISAERDGGIGRVRGLRDSLARDPMAVIGPEARERLQWDWQWQPYLSMEREFLLARAKQVLQPPASVGITLDGASLQLTGQAPREWIDGMREAAPRIAGISGYRDDGLVATEQALERYSRVIESTALYFDVKEFTLSESDIGRLQALVPTIRLLQAGAEELGLTVTIRVEGHADQSGSEAQNLRLSELRANSVTQVLVDQGLEPSLFSPVGLGSRSPVVTGPALEDGGLERRVSLNVLLQDPIHEAELVRP